MRVYETLQEQKEDDFLAAYDRFLLEHKNDGVSYKTAEICKLISEMPAPRFYILPHVAKQRIDEYRYHGKRVKNPTHRKMHEEIFRRFYKLQEELGDKAYTYSIVETVVSQEAPCWYLEPYSARDLYYKAMRHRRERARSC